MEQVQGLNTSMNQIVAELLTSGMRGVWKKFMEEFNQVFDVEQLDPVLSLLKQLESNSQNPVKKQQTKEKKEADDLSSENENDNNESSTLEKNIFGNHLLAKSVFKYVPHNDLLSCRRVNSYWNEFATEILLKRNNEMWFIRRKTSNRYFQQDSWEKPSNWRTLDMFTELLKTSKQFPCNKFEFSGGNLGNDDAQRFLSFYGKFVKSITIFLEDEDLDEDIGLSETGFSVSLTDSRTIGMILSEQLPNLEELELDLDLLKSPEMDWDGNKSLLFPPEKNIKLPHLKTLDCYSRNSVGILRQLLNAATNLKQVGSSFVLQDFDLFIETGKVKLISRLDFDVDKLEKVEKLANQKPELNYLDLSNVHSLYKQPQLWKRTSILLSKLIESSQNSLNELDGFRSLGFLPQLQLPVLKNVKNIDLQVISESSFNPQDVHDYSFSCLPRGVTFSRNFPQLRSLEIRFDLNISNNDDAAVWWAKYFPTDEIVQTVKTLKIRYTDACPDFWMRKLSCMFPNVNSLSALGITDFSSFSPSIWNYYQKLTELKLEIDLTSPHNSAPHSLDSSFTGIPVEAWPRLEKFSLATLEQIGDNFVQNPSILNLKDLINLDITFSVDSKRYQALKPLSTFTLLSGTCAFKSLKSLKSVNISVEGLDQNQDIKLEIKESLKQLLPYKVIIK